MVLDHQEDNQYLWHSPTNSRMDQHQENELETLLEQLGSLRITEKDTSNKITEIETTDKILIVLVQQYRTNRQYAKEHISGSRIVQWGQNKI